MPNPELWEAALDNDAAGVRRCLDRGDEVDGKGSLFNMTPLIAAARHKDPTMLKEARDDLGRTPLDWARMRDSVDCVRVLTEHGAREANTHR